MTDSRTMTPPYETALRKQAADWAYRLREDDVAQEEFATWLEWYESDPRHKAVYDDMQSFLAQLEPVVEGTDALRPELWLGDIAAAKPRVAAPAVSRRTEWRRRRIWAAAAAAAVVVGITTLWLMPQFAPDATLSTLLTPRGAQQHYAATDNNSQATLADGSQMELASRTKVSVELTERQRTVTLQQGAAFFTVAHNAARPFLVKVGGFNVRAVGTAFNVRSAGPRMVVTVAEGTVEVYSRDRGTSVLARAGTEIAWSALGGSPIVTAVDPAHALAWKEGRLDYFKEPLESVVADINRYSRKPVRVNDAAVRELAVTGTVRTDGIEEWLQALPAMFPVNVSTGEDGAIVLSARAGS